jgi:hypothetical protein
LPFGPEQRELHGHSWYLSWRWVVCSVRQDHQCGCRCSKDPYNYHKCSLLLGSRTRSEAQCSHCASMETPSVADSLG